MKTQKHYSNDLKCRRKDFDKQLGKACDKTVNKIKDPALRNCVNESCKNGTVLCGDCTGQTSPDAGGFTVRGSLSAPVRWFKFCTNTIKGANLGDIAIHEWAHGCGWGHGDGKGVPGNSGRLPN